MSDPIAYLVGALLVVAFLAAGGVGLYLTEQLLWQEWGWLGIVVGNLMFPVAAPAAALYDGFANGDWTLAIIDGSFPLLYGVSKILD